MSAELFPWDERHGHYYAYTKLGCRCVECRAACAKYRSRLRARHQLRGDAPEHGTNNAYDNYGCRCEECRAATLVRRKNRAKA